MSSKRSTERITPPNLMLYDVSEPLAGGRGVSATEGYARVNHSSL
jgi:hypothetical protein